MIVRGRSGIKQEKDKNVLRKKENMVERAISYRENGGGITREK